MNSKCPYNNLWSDIPKTRVPIEKCPYGEIPKVGVEAEGEVETPERHQQIYQAAELFWEENKEEILGWLKNPPEELVQTCKRQTPWRILEILEDRFGPPGGNRKGIWNEFAYDWVDEQEYSFDTANSIAGFHPYTRVFFPMVEVLPTVFEKKYKRKITSEEYRQLVVSLQHVNNEMMRVDDITNKTLLIIAPLPKEVCDKVDSVSSSVFAQIKMQVEGVVPEYDTLYNPDHFEILEKKPGKYSFVLKPEFTENIKRIVATAENRDSEYTGCPFLYIRGFNREITGAWDVLLEKVGYYQSRLNI